jgi:hypothetical protein
MCVIGCVPGDALQGAHSSVWMNAFEIYIHLRMARAVVFCVPAGRGDLHRLQAVCVARPGMFQVGMQGSLLWHRSPAETGAACTLLQNTSTLC